LQLLENYSWSLYQLPIQGSCKYFSFSWLDGFLWSLGNGFSLLTMKLGS
jgi:hypothetical protein